VCGIVQGSAEDITGDSQNFGVVSSFSNDFGAKYLIFSRKIYYQ
jgi:hypothetical protein